MKYLIWSHRHREWWRAERQGYSRTLSDAGRYSKADAADIVLSGLPGSNTAIDEHILNGWKGEIFAGDAEEIEAELEHLRRM
jgi:hypothetical protein